MTAAHCVYNIKSYNATEPLIIPLNPYNSRYGCRIFKLLIGLKKFLKKISQENWALNFFILTLKKIKFFF